MIEKLPDEQFVSTTYRRIGLTVLSVFILCLFANVAVWFYLKRDISDVVTAKWSMLDNLIGPVDVLILGDSSAGLGVDPQVWADATGESAINLGTYGLAMVVNDALMLETYVDRFGPPQKVVIVHVYDIWNRPMKQSVMFRIPFKVMWKLRSYYFDGYDILRPLKAQLFPLYYQDVTIPDLIKNSLVEKLFRPGSDMELATRYDSGFYALREPRPDLVTVDTRDRLNRLRTNEISASLSPINAAALQRIAMLADNHGFDVYLASSPLHEDLALDSSFQEYFSNLKLSLAEFASKSPRMHLIMDELVTFDKNSMQNSNHVLYDSAQIYTQWLFDNTRGASR